MGLLESGPNCPNGHGPMVVVPGEWAMQQIARSTNERGEPFGLPTGRLYGFDLFRCATCGVIQLYDRDTQ